MKEDNKYNQIVERKETIFTKIGNFLKNLFGSKKEENICEETVENTEIKVAKENEFLKQIKIEQNPERDRLLKLQQDFRDGKITQGDLSDDEIEKLGELYDEQIEKVKVQIEEIRKQIEDKKRKLQKA